MSLNGSRFVKYFKFFRITDWIHLLGLTMLGYVYASRTAFFSNCALISIIASALYLAHGYSINLCFDNKVRNNVEISGKYLFPFKKAVLLSFFIFTANLIFTFVYSIKLLPLVIFGSLISLFYSAYPFRLKGIPFIGLLCNSLCFIPLFLIGYMSVRAMDMNVFLMSIFIFFLFMPIDLIHQLNDADNDRKMNFRTTVVACGIRKTVGLIIICLFSLNLWLLFISWYMNISYSILLITFIFSLWFIAYLIIKFYRYGNDMSKYKLKYRLRFLFIIYGISLLWFFLHHP